MTSDNRNLFLPPSVSTVKTRIIPTARPCPTSWRWRLRLRSSSRGESSALLPPFHSPLPPHPCPHLIPPSFSSVSLPDKVFLPASWKSTKNYRVEQDVGPGVEHVYEVSSPSRTRLGAPLDSSHSFPAFFIQLVNNGPSNISQTVLELRCPLSFQGQSLLYPLDFSTKGPINCTSDRTLNPLHLQVSPRWSPAGVRCVIGRRGVPTVVPQPPPPLSSTPPGLGSPGSGLPSFNRLSLHAPSAQPLASVPVVCVCV